MAKVHIQGTSLLEITLLDEDVFKVDEVEELVEIQEDYDITMYFDSLKYEQGGGAKVVKYKAFILM